MKTKRWIILGFIILVAAGAVLFFTVGKGEKPSQMLAQGHAHGKATAVSQPEAVSEQEPPTVEIPEDRQRLIGVKTTAVEVTDLAKIMRLTGRIEYDEQKLTTVNTKVEGWIERLYVDYTGRYLKKGEPLLEIYSPELLSAQQELINLSSWKKPEGTSGVNAMIDADSQRLSDAARQRLRLWDVSDAQIERIIKTGEPIRTITIISPVSGYVVKRYATRGMKVMAGEPLLDIANLSEVWVVSEVNETDSGIIRQGMPARITVTGLPGKVFSSKIDFIYPTLSEQTRTLKLRCMLPNPGETLKPQMFAVVEIAVNLGKKLSVPEDSVMDTGERQIVYVDRGQGLFEPRAVVTGLRGDGRREIVSGLKAGERVASSALFLIDSEAQLKGVAPASNE
jgi:Cu(I)/Ag(I) efflux system membrane fusion protein